jgi:hypothetical protein
VKTRGLVVLGWLWIVVASAVAAQAQGPYRSPAGPTLPPQLNYFRQDTGVLDQYNGLVAPITQTQQAVQQLQSGVSQQRLQLQNLQGEIQQIREGPVARTGTASRFMNYSHYYRIQSPQRLPTR